jgi:2-oxoadipate dioxygenase/decarboxylase
LAEKLTARLQESDLKLSAYKHAGFKDFTEGPSRDTPVLLRQDAYKALTEAVAFQQPDGTTIKSEHTARFGEIEQRFYATTPAGRALYDKCLANAEAARAKTPDLPAKDYAAYQKQYAECFAPFPKTLTELLQKKLVYGCYRVTTKGLAAKTAGKISSDDIDDLINAGYVEVDGLRYEDFLPISAAGIFASNLGQYGTKSTASEKPLYSKETLEQIMGKPIIDTDALYRELETESLRAAREKLGLGELAPA